MSFRNRQLNRGVEQSRQTLPWRFATLAASVAAWLFLGCSVSEGGTTDDTSGAPRDSGSADMPSTDAAAEAQPESAQVQPWVPSFETLQLSSDFVAEGAAIADIDGDGELDLLAGVVWYQGPKFEERYDIDEAPAVDVTAYSRYFLTFVDDLNGDGAIDVINIGDAGGGGATGTPNAWWYENPGPSMVTAAWPRHDLYDGLVSNESPAYADLLGDERKELVFMTDGKLGWAEPGPDPTQLWSFHAISDSIYATPYVHGLGVADVDGDGQMDVLDARTWWRRGQGGGWVGTSVDFVQGIVSPIAGGAQMYAFDVDGDSDSDVITSLSGHGYGLSWFEQTPTWFEPHEILPPHAAEGNVSQLHAMMIADMNGDGLSDLVTGKRYFAHSSGDPGVDGAALLYWFELKREDGGAHFVPHLIHDDSGVGCSFAVADVDGNGRPDVLTSSKKGTFLHRQ